MSCEVVSYRTGESRLTKAHRTAPEDRPQVVPLSFALHQSEPNPFSHAARIRFELPHASKVRLEIFDLQGRRVAVLADGLYTPGAHACEWDGRSGGWKARPGVYLCRLQAGSFQAQRKLVLVP